MNKDSVTIAQGESSSPDNIATFVKDAENWLRDTEANPLSADRVADCRAYLRDALAIIKSHKQATVIEHMVVCGQGAVGINLG